MWSSCVTGLIHFCLSWDPGIEFELSVTCFKQTYLDPRYKNQLTNDQEENKISWREENKNSEENESVESAICLLKRATAASSHLSCLDSSCSLVSWFCSWGIRLILFLGNSIRLSSAAASKPILAAWPPTTKSADQRPGRLNARQTPGLLVRWICADCRWLGSGWLPLARWRQFLVGQLPLASQSSGWLPLALQIDCNGNFWLADCS